MHAFERKMNFETKQQKPEFGLQFMKSFFTMKSKVDNAVYWQKLQQKQDNEIFTDRLDAYWLCVKNFE
jgi:hypothetical protein